MARQVPRPGQSLLDLLLCSRYFSFLRHYRNAWNRLWPGAWPRRSKVFAIYFDKANKQNNDGKKVWPNMWPKNAATITEVENLTNNYSTRTCWI